MSKVYCTFWKKCQHGKLCMKALKNPKLFRGVLIKKFLIPPFMCFEEKESKI